MPGFSQPGRAGGAPGGEAPPTVRLGELADGGLAPAIMAIVERGVSRRPDRARELGIEVELRTPGVAPHWGWSPHAGCGSRAASA